MHGDWVTATAAIIGAVIGVVGTLLIEYFRSERRIIRFVINAPEDLAAALRNHGSTFELKVNNVATQTLNVAEVTIENRGNVTINDFTFDIALPGKHNLAQAQPVSENKKLASALQVIPATNPVQGYEEQPFFKISLPFFNPGEAFKIATFYDGDPARCQVDCRLPSVRVLQSTQEDVQRRYAVGEDFAKLVARLVGIGIAGAIATAITSLIAALTH